MMGWETLYLNTTLNLMPTKYSVQPDGPTCTGDETSTETGSGDTETDAKKEKKEKKKKETASDNMNIRGVFLHVLADALGSIVVIISAGVILGTDPPADPEAIDPRNYVDPALSIILVAIILASTWPLLRDSSHILMQGGNSIETILA